MCSAESKVLTALWTKFSNASIDSGFCSRPVLCIVHRIFFYIGVMFVGLPSSEAVRIADNESMGQNPNTRIHHQKGTSMLNTSFTKTNTIFGQALGCTALDDAFVKLLSNVNADGVTQFLVRTNGVDKVFECVNRLWILFQTRFVYCPQNFLLYWRYVCRVAI